MKSVNLAAKPFVNRRPVIRVAAVVWVLAIGLLIWNLWSYGDFFRTVATHRSTLADLESEIGATQEQNDALRRRIEALKLDENNSTATYLNGLIHQRVFPWSRLFDDIEDVLPKDVYLSGLSPQIQKIEKTPTRRTSTRSTAAKTRSSKNTPPRKAPKVAEKPKDLDRVEMTISGYSRSDEAMLELVDRLYASPTFLDPELAFERRDKGGLLSFSISVTYLTRARPVAPAPGGTLADAGAEPGAAGTPAGAAEAGGTVAGGEGQYAEGTPGPAGELYGQPGFVAPGGAAAPGRPGRPASRPGFEPDAGAAPGGAGAVPGGTAGGPATGGWRNRAGAASSQSGQTGQSGQNLQGGVFVPGAAPAAGAPPGSGTGGTVIPPRRTPGGLLPTASASPRGGG